MTSKTKTRTLHFRVDPNIINIIRQAYWYEEGRKEWAMDCLRSLGGNMTLDIAHDLLEGKNGLTTHDDESLTLTNKPDIEFQRELAQHKKFLEEQKRREEEENRWPFCSNEASLQYHSHREPVSQDQAV